MILKHRLRPNERELFSTDRPSVTKIILPMDGRDLRLGGQYVFVGQRNYDAILANTFGGHWGVNSRDRQILAIMDATPSLDPFLLRERLARVGIHPADCYLDISKPDQERMLKFATEEVSTLVRLSLSNGPSALSQHSAKLANDILSSQIGDNLEPLRETLKMSHEEFSDGVFSWKGFLYYKWCYIGMVTDIVKLNREIMTVFPRDKNSLQARTAFHGVRNSLKTSIKLTMDAIRATLDVYERAFENLTSRDNPSAFREFLLTAPSLFEGLGSQLAVINHMISFWAYRFPLTTQPSAATTDELVQVFKDFEQSLVVDANVKELVW